MIGVRARYVGHRPDLAAIRAVLGGDPGSGAGRDLDARGRRVEAAARGGVGVQSGRLLASIHREPGHGAGGAFVDIVAGAPGRTPYLGYHLYGTGPHIIAPRRASALRFASGGKIVFARSVKHPGTRGNNFLARALAAAG